MIGVAVPEGRRNLAGGQAQRPQPPDSVLKFTAPRQGRWKQTGRNFAPLQSRTPAGVQFRLWVASGGYGSPLARLATG